MLKNKITKVLIFGVTCLAVLTGCQHLSDVNASSYTVDDLSIDTDSAKMEVLQGYKDYSGKVVKVSPVNGGNWADYCRSVYWEWSLNDDDDTKMYQVTISMSVMAERSISNKPLISAYRPSEKISYTPSTIAWNGPANLGWTIQTNDDTYTQFGGNAVEIPTGQWKDLKFAQIVDLSNSDTGQVFLDGHNDHQGLIDLTLYIRDFEVTLTKATSRPATVTKPKT